MPSGEATGESTGSTTGDQVAGPETTGPETTGPETAGGARPDPMAVLRALGVGALAERMGLEVSELAPDRVVGSLPVEGNTQPYGLLHGGASLVLAETLGSFGSAVHAGPGRVALGIEINASHHRAAYAGRVTGVATPVQLGRTLATWDVVVTDDEGRRVCTSRITCLIRDAAPGSGGSGPP